MISTSASKLQHLHLYKKNHLHRMSWRKVAHNMSTVEYYEANNSKRCYVFFQALLKCTTALCWSMLRREGTTNMPPCRQESNWVSLTTTTMLAVNMPLLRLVSMFYTKKTWTWQDSFCHSVCYAFQNQNVLKIKITHLGWDPLLGFYPRQEPLFLEVYSIIATYIFFITIEYIFEVFRKLSLGFF